MDNSPCSRTFIPSVSFQFSVKSKLNYSEIHWLIGIIIFRFEEKSSWKIVWKEGNNGNSVWGTLKASKATERTIQIWRDECKYLAIIQGNKFRLFLLSHLNINLSSPNLQYGYDIFDVVVDFDAFDHLYCGWNVRCMVDLNPKSDLFYCVSCICLFER